MTRWRLDPPQNSAEKVELAGALFALARFAEAREELRGLRSAAARVLRAWCHSKLGEIKAAERIVRQLESAPLEPEELLEAAELAVRTYGNLGEADRATRWVERLLASGDLELSLRGRLLAATAAWDRQDLEAMGKHLEDARPALERPSSGLALVPRQGPRSPTPERRARGHCQSRVRTEREPAAAASLRGLGALERSGLWPGADR